MIPFAGSVEIKVRKRDGWSPYTGNPLTRASTYHRYRYLKPLTEPYADEWRMGEIRHKLDELRASANELDVTDAPDTDQRQARHDRADYLATLDPDIQHRVRFEDRIQFHARQYLSDVNEVKESLKFLLNGYAYIDVVNPHNKLQRKIRKLPDSVKITFRVDGTKVWFNHLLNSQWHAEEMDDMYRYLSREEDYRQTKERLAKESWKDLFSKRAFGAIFKELIVGPFIDRRSYAALNHTHEVPLFAEIELIDKNGTPQKLGPFDRKLPGMPGAGFLRVRPETHKDFVNRIIKTAKRASRAHRAQ